MRSLRSASTWPHPNHQQPITEQETGQREGGGEREREKESCRQEGPDREQGVRKQKRQERLVQVVQDRCSQQLCVCACVIRPTLEERL